VSLPQDDRSIDIIAQTRATVKNGAFFSAATSTPLNLAAIVALTSERRFGRPINGSHAMDAATNEHSNSKGATRLVTSWLRPGSIRAHVAAAIGKRICIATPPTRTGRPAPTLVRARHDGAATGEGCRMLRPLTGWPAGAGEPGRLQKPCPGPPDYGRFRENNRQWRSPARVGVRRL
jgi:hypothetical protein